MKNQLNKAKQFLKEKKTILYPTDTVWGIGCDATSKKAVKRIYKIKQREESKSLIILVNGFEMLADYVDFIPEIIKTYLVNIEKPTTVIYNKPKNLAKNIIAQDNTIAIRIVKKGFVYELLKEFGKPIVSTSANISGEKTPLYFDDISNKIINDVDFIVNHNQEKKASKSSKIIKFANNKIEVLRD